MSARRPIFNALVAPFAGNLPVGHDEAKQLLDAHRAEVIAEFEAYPGELAMLRGVLGMVRTIAKHSDMDELRRVIAEHYADESAAYAEQAEKATPTGESTPQPIAAPEAFTAVASPVEYGYVIAVRRDPHEAGRVPLVFAPLHVSEWSPDAASQLLLSDYSYETAPGSYWQPLGDVRYGIRLRRTTGGDAR